MLLVASKCHRQVATWPSRLLLALRRNLRPKTKQNLLQSHLPYRCTRKDVRQVSTLATKPHFSDLPLDRAGRLRKDQAALERLIQHPEARVCVFFGRKALVITMKEKNANKSLKSTPDGKAPEFILRTWHPHQLQEFIDESIGYIFLGLDKEIPVFACQLSKMPTENFHDDDILIDVRSQGQKMAGNDAAILALASGLLQWHANTKYCAQTGAPMVPRAGGHSREERISENSDGATTERQKRHTVYPRTDPAVIVAVTYHQDWILLGRKKSWEAGRYSLLAGFSEVGETLEDAVVREVFEESGVRVNYESIRYHSSQPWPFPQSLMIGFFGTAQVDVPNQIDPPTHGRGFDVLPNARVRQAAIQVGLRPKEAELYTLPQISVDEKELEDARWFHKEWLRENLLGSNNYSNSLDTESPSSFRIPGKYALANTMITDWVGEKLPGENTRPQWMEHALIPSVRIDRPGSVFKYVLMRVSSSDGEYSKLIVRGDSHAEYHNHILQNCMKEASAVDPQLRVEVLGGGRMEHYDGLLSIYGYSAAFGAAPHEVVATIIRSHDPFIDISVSYEGY